MGRSQSQILTISEIRKWTESARADVRQKIIKYWAPNGLRVVVETPRYLVDMKLPDGGWYFLEFDFVTASWTTMAQDERCHGVGIIELGVKLSGERKAVIARLIWEIIGSNNQTRRPVLAMCEIEKRTGNAHIDARHKILKKWAPHGRHEVVETPQYFADMNFPDGRWIHLVFDLVTAGWTIQTEDELCHGLGIIELGAKLSGAPEATIARLIWEIIGGDNALHSSGDPNVAA